MAKGHLRCNVLEINKRDLWLLDCAGTKTLNYRKKRGKSHEEFRQINSGKKKGIEWWPAELGKVNVRSTDGNTERSAADIRSNRAYFKRKKLSTRTRQSRTFREGQVAWIHLISLQDQCFSIFCKKRYIRNSPSCSNGENLIKTLFSTFFREIQKGWCHLIRQWRSMCTLKPKIENSEWSIKYWF